MNARGLRGSLLVAAWLARCAPSALAQTAAEPTEIAVHGVHPRRDASETKLSADSARQQVGTEDDPAKAVSNLPGLARAGLGTEQLVLWGAAPEDTRVYVDGVEIPQLFHGSALRSTVNGDLLQSVALSPGAFGADYGRAIGGMVRLETRDALEDGYHAKLELSTLDASALLSAPLSERIHLTVAARYGLLDRALSAVGARDVSEFFAVPRYRDYQAKVQVALRERESLDLVLLGSGDDLSRSSANSDPARARSNFTDSAFQRVYLRYRRALEDGSSVEAVPWVGRDELHYTARLGANAAYLAQSAVRWGVRAEQRSRVSDQVALRFGLDTASAHTALERQGSLTVPTREGDVYVFGQPPGDDTNSDRWHITVLNVAPYASVDWDAGPVTFSPGLRFDLYLLEASRSTPRIGQTPALAQSALDAEIEPRFSARWRMSSRAALLGAVGLYSQPPAAQDLSAVFGTPSLGPERAAHASLAESVELTSSLSVNVTGFYRALTELNVRAEAPNPKLAHALVPGGVGRSYGAQVLLRQKQWHGLSGSVAYTLSRSERRDAPDAATRLFDYDEPHVLTALGSAAWSAWSFGLRFRYATGAPRTPVLGALYDERDNVFQPIFGAHNSLRLPVFWQLDARLDRTFALGQRRRLVTYVEVLNVTNRANGEEYRYDADFGRRGVITGLPLVGAIGARLEL
ncbi:MAG: TonB-dependent receptor plug domain-containing protein [Polyangiaceae bacterium]